MAGLAWKSSINWNNFCKKCHRIANNGPLFLFVLRFSASLLLLIWIKSLRRQRHPPPSPRNWLTSSVTNLDCAFIRSVTRARYAGEQIPAFAEKKYMVGRGSGRKCTLPHIVGQSIDFYTHPNPVKRKTVKRKNNNRYLWVIPPLLRFSWKPVYRGFRPCWLRIWIPFFDILSLTVLSFYRQNHGGAIIIGFQVFRF